MKDYQLIRSPQTVVRSLLAGYNRYLKLTLYVGTVVQVWKGQNGPVVQNQLESILTGGYAALLSSGYYLDVQIPNVNQTFYLALGTNSMRRYSKKGKLTDSRRRMEKLLHQ